MSATVVEAFAPQRMQLKVPVDALTFTTDTSTHTADTLTPLTKLWLLTISLNCIEMNRRLLVNNNFILHSLLGKLTILLITRP